MSHSLANCCHTFGSRRREDIFSPCQTGSACRSSVDEGTGNRGVGRAHSAAAWPLVVDHLYWDASRSLRLLLLAASLALRAFFLREVRAISSRLKFCGCVDLTMGFSDARRTVESLSLEDSEYHDITKRCETKSIRASLFSENALVAWVWHLVRMRVKCWRLRDAHIRIYQSAHARFAFTR